MKYLRIVMLAIFILSFFLNCDLFDPNNPDNCDGTWSVSGTNDNGSTYYVELYVYDGHIRRFISSTTESPTSNAFSFRLDGINGASIAEIFYDEDIKNYTNSHELYDESDGTLNNEGYLEGIDGYWYEYDTAEEHFQGYFHPDKGVVEGSFHFKGSYDSQQFLAELEER